MTEIKEISIVQEDIQWICVAKELIEAGVTKEEFKKFLEQKRKKKNLS